MGIPYELDKYGIRVDPDAGINFDRAVTFNEAVTYEDAQTFNEAAAFNETVAMAKAPTIDGNQVEQVAKVALAALDTGGGVLAWANPEAVSIIITGIFLNVTTKSTGACTLDVGTTATDATTSSDNLLDGVDVGTAIGLFDNVTEKGTNGKSRQLLATGKWITASKASGNAAGLVGFAYIRYVRLTAET